METLSDLLHSYMDTNNINIYQFAKEIGMDRTTLHKYISGKRFPAKDAYLAIVSRMQLSPSERQRIDNCFEMYSIGVGLYHQRQYIKDSIVAFSDLYQTELQPTQIAASEDNHFTSHTLSHTSVHGLINTIQLVQTELLRCVTCHEHPTADIFLPHVDSGNFQKVVFSTLQNNTDHQLSLQQIFMLNRQSVDKEQFNAHNIQALFTALPFSFSNYLQYKAFCYYEQHTDMDNYALIYPYYIILNDRLILLSKDLEHAVLIVSASLAEDYRASFNERIHECQLFTYTARKYEEIIMSFLTPAAPTEHEYWLDSEPCLSSIGTYEDANEILKPDLENRELFLQMIMQRLQHLQSHTDMHHFFTKAGLDRFLSTGKCMEFPLCYANIIAPQRRLILMKRMYEACASDRQILRIVNEHKFPVANDLSFSVSEKQVSFCNFTKADEWVLLTSSEPNIISALQDFIQSLPDSHLVYSKEDTLQILSDKIKEYEDKLS